ncbi:hypothetical protein GW17_00050444 [Ensete ventricosum]|nr:hypothetical protein GW17_00050444 [Ensete ventricosum]
MQWDLARSSLGDSLKGSGSSLGARREIIGRRPDDLSQECRSQRQVLVGIRKVEETTFVKIQTGKPLGRRVNCPYLGVRVAEPPRLTGKSLVPSFSKYV